MTQREVAEAAGVSLRSYVAFEKGETVPQQRNLEAILSVLPVDAEQLDLDGARDNTVAGWPADVQMFHDMMGTYADMSCGVLATRSEEERQAYIRNVTAYIHAQTRTLVAHPPTPDPE